MNECGETIWSWSDEVVLVASKHPTDELVTKHRCALSPEHEPGHRCPCGAFWPREPEARK
jgi:hypothetical protein